MIKNLTIETNAPDDYMTDILRRVRLSVSRGHHKGRGRINRANMVVYTYSYSCYIPVPTIKGTCSTCGRGGMVTCPQCNGRVVL